jgi:thiol:disulfide interchange protein DsbD
MATILHAVLAGLVLAQGAAVSEGDPVTWSIKAQLPAAPIKAGGTLTVQVTAKIERGWHLYSLNPIENGPRPTRIAIAAGQPFEAGGAIKAPDPIVARDPNFNLDTEYYENSVTFTVPVKVAPHAAKGKSTLTMQVRFQTCNDRLCMPPKVVKLDVPVEIG